MEKPKDSEIQKGQYIVPLLVVSHTKLVVFSGGINVSLGTRNGLLLPSVKTVIARKQAETDLKELKCSLPKHVGEKIHSHDAFRSSIRQIH